MKPPLKRLASTLALDMRLQYRHGIPYAAALAALIGIAGSIRLPDAALDRLLPVFILSNLILHAFYFASGLVLREKREGTLAMLDLTPLRPHEYLASKAATLVLLSGAANLAMVLAARGRGFQPLPLAAGMAAGGTLLVLLGFAAVSRVSSWKEFLLPSAAYVLVLLAPLLPQLGWAESRWFLLHPMQAPLTLIRAAFRPVAPWELAYGAGYSLLWSVIGLAACRWAFARLRETREADPG